MKVKTDLLLVKVIILSVLCLAAGSGKVWGGSGVYVFKPRLFVLSIGINKYKQAKYDLQFARQDAEIIGASLKMRGDEKIFSEIKKIQLLLDEKATRANILAALDELSGEVASGDTLIVTFSGRGEALGLIGKNSRDLGARIDLPEQFYLFPADVDADRLDETAVSSELLQIYLQRIRAENKLFVLDSCNSAGGYERIAETFIRKNQRMVDENSLFIGVDTQSFDDFDRKQGVLTAVMFDGLTGEADFDNNGTVTARELEAYTYRGVLPFSIKHADYGGVHPRTIFSGKDFDIALTDVQITKLKYEKFKNNELNAELQRLQLKRKSFGDLDRESWLKSLSQKKSATEKEIADLKSQTEQKDLRAKLAVKSDELKEINIQIQKKSEEFEARKKEGEKFDMEIKVANEIIAARKIPQETRSKLFETAETKKKDAPRDGEDYALLFANDIYNPKSDWDNLKNPYNDVLDIAQELQKSYGFKKENIAILRNLTKSQIEDVIIKYQGDDIESEVYYSETEQYDSSKFRKVTFKPDDQLFVFFAGHGHAYEGGKDGTGQPKVNGLLISSDSPTFIDKRDKDKFVQLDSLVDGIDSIPNRHIMVVFDACFAGQLWKPRLQPFKENTAIFSQKTDEATAGLLNISSRIVGKSFADFSLSAENTINDDISRNEYIRRAMGNRSRVVFTSGSKPVPDGYCEKEEDGVCVKRSRNSPFAAKFIEALRKKAVNHDVLTAYEMIPMFKILPQRVEKGKLDDLSDGDFVFVVPK